jgi:hypothetical protein
MIIKDNYVSDLVKKVEVQDQIIYAIVFNAAPDDANNKKCCGINNVDSCST